MPARRFCPARMLVRRSASASIHSLTRRSRDGRWLVAGLFVPDAQGLGDGARSPGRLAASAAADAGALVHQRGHRHAPALADIADAVGVGDADLGHVDLVELGLAGDLAQRPDLDSGGVHVEGEVGQALVLGRLGVGAGHEHAAVGDVGERVPHLLAADHPLVAVAHRLGGQAGQVGAGAGLAEQLAPGVLAGEGAPQQALLDGLVAVGDDRGPRHGEAEEVAGTRVGGARRVDAPVDVPLGHRGEAEAAVALGEVDPGEPQVVLAAAELGLVDGVRIDVGQQLVDPLGDQGGSGVTHGRNIGRRSTT